MKRQAVITGLGIVSPIGVGVEKFWAAALAGRSGISTPTLFDASKLSRECQIVGEVKDFNVRDWMPGAAGKMAGRFSQFAVAAAKMARDDSRLDDAEIPGERVLVSIGSSVSGLADVQLPFFSAYLHGDFLSPWAVLESPGHAAASHVSISSGGRGQTTAFATACVAGLDAVTWAAERVCMGEATAAIAGGTESPISESSLEAFRVLGALSQWIGPASEASRPFDRLRSGLVLAEGAAVVIVEDEADARARGANIYARILGSASVSEGTHMREVNNRGDGAARVMRLALHRAGLCPRDIDYICAHGNSLPDYDAAETAGIKAAFGMQASCVAVSSIKSMCGQALAASGAMQIVTACLALRDNVVPPTINYVVPDPACDLDYVPNVARRARVEHVLVHAQSIGGSHSALILGKGE